MHEILKRLEIIKTAIAIDDKDIIELQITKLKSFKLDGEVEKILTLSLTKSTKSG